MPKISPALLDFVLQYGEMASHWGLNKTESQIHGLLYVSENPLNTEDIMEALAVGRSHVSQSLKELLRWGLIKTVAIRGDRREHFDSIKDVWDLFRAAVNEQKRREIEPLLLMLESASAQVDEKTEAFARDQILSMLEFFQILSAWFDQMKGIPIPVIKNFLKAGSKLAGLLPKGQAAG